MPNSIRLPVIALLILILAEVTSAEVVTIEVTIKAVDATGRTITATRKGKTLELDVSRKAPVMINGKAGKLDALAAGQTAKIDYETKLEIITKIEVTGKALPAPELLLLREISTAKHESGIWLSPDGLTIYWHLTGDDGKWIWTAKRKTPDSLFEGKMRLIPGSDPTVTGDGLEMILQVNGLYSTSRDSVDSPFNRPRAITELSKHKLTAPCISDDGLTMYVDQNENNSRHISVITRETRESQWGDPRPLHGLEDQSVRSPFVTSDGRMLFGTNPNVDGKEQCNVTVFSRSRAEDPFQFLGFVDCPVLQQGGMFPRYCSSTGELFLALVTEGKTGGDLMVVKNFSPANMVRKDVKPVARPTDDPRSALIGKWEEDRAEGKKNYREFRSNGSFIFTGVDKRISNGGKWRMEDKMVYYKLPQDKQETPFEVLKVEKDRLTILMKGERAYTWKRAK